MYEDSKQVGISNRQETEGDAITDNPRLANAWIGPVSSIGGFDPGDISTVIGTKWTVKLDLGDRAHGPPSGKPL